MNETELLKQKEDRRVRMLRISTDLVVQVLMTTPLTASQAQQIICGVRNLALELFPGKADTFDLIYLPRFRRALKEAGAHPGNLPAILRDDVSSCAGS